MGNNFSDSGSSEDESEEIPQITTLKSMSDWESHSRSNSDKLMVVDFTAAWCIFCRIMAPTLNSLAKNNPDVTFVKIDMTSPENPFTSLARDYNVRGYPTFLLLRNGKEVDRVVGANKDDLEKKVAEKKSIRQT
ncbi:Monodehydroascorbate reductase (NADH) [Bertholletia excelsa]